MAKNKKLIDFFIVELLILLFMTIILTLVSISLGNTMNVIGTSIMSLALGILLGYLALRKYH